MPVSSLFWDALCLLAFGNMLGFTFGVEGIVRVRRPSAFVSSGPSSMPYGPSSNDHAVVAFRIAGHH